MALQKSHDLVTPASDASSTGSCSYFRSSASGVVQELQATNDGKDPEAPE